MSIDVETVNGLAGVAALLNGLLMLPAIRALRKIAGAHENRLQNHETRIDNLELAKPKGRRRGRRGVL